MDYEQPPNRVNIYIDMKLFFASVSSVMRGLDSLNKSRPFATMPEQYIELQK